MINKTDLSEQFAAVASGTSASNPLLSVSDLKVHFPLKRGFLVRREVARVRAVDGVSFDIMPGETLGLVGESGSGKTTAAKAVIQLTKPESGSVKFEGQELVGLGSSAMRPIRRKMGMVFQDPYGSLNPRMRAGDIVGEPLKVHGLSESKDDYRKQVASLMTTVGLSPAMAERYPNEFSGGQRQRLGVARAIAARPSLLILDESVSALDVSIQAQILNLLQDLQEQYNLAYLFIAHDLSVVRHISHRVAVMYLGQFVEVSNKDQLFNHPLHPYTRGLIEAARLDDLGLNRETDSVRLSGELSEDDAKSVGCRLTPRCPFAESECKKPQQLTELRSGQFVRCWKALDIEGLPGHKESFSPSKS